MLITTLFIYAAGAYIIWDFYDTAKRRKREAFGWAVIGGLTYFGVVVIFPRLILIPLTEGILGENPGFGGVILWVTLGHLATIGTAVGCSLWVLKRFLDRKPQRSQP